MVQFKHHKNMHVKSPSSPNSKSSNPSDRDNLILTRKGGGSIIDHRPLFSNDGETLYVIWKHAVRAYSTQTGDFVRELEPVDQRIANIISHPDSINTIVGCTDIGEIHFWNCQSGIITKKLKLQFNTNEFTKVRTFHIVKYKTAIGNEVSQIVLTYTAKCYKKIYVLLFDIESGRCCKSTHIFVESPKYYVDVIGNQGNNLIALLHDSDLHILNPARNLVDKLHKTGKTGRMPTCIAGHPEDECVATGDSTGRVVVWRSLFQTRPYTAVYHWHTLPVTEIVFSKSGAQMYTGGGECVLVKWILANPHEKSFLPRLPAPIKHLTIAPDNLYVAVSTLDNGILIVNPQRKVTSVIQNFTWGISLSYKDMFPAGLTIDPRTNSLVLNSRTGHVQFYSTHTKSLLYNINITGQNFITQERNVNILNTEVTKIALNHIGTWMATVEERNDKFSHAEVRLKFWIFDFKKQLFTLNTSIELPHEEGVSALQFQPTTMFGDEDHLAVTVGKDKRFKLWNLAEPTSIHKKTRHWYCYSTGDYRNLNSTDAGFSVDGSLLGVGFESTLTIWEPDTCTLKRSLTHSQYPYQITRIEFGKHETCNLIVVASSEHIAVWNILSLSITWSVPLKTTLLAADPKSVYMAVFTSDNTLHVFTPQSSSPVYTKKRIIENGSSVLGAVFVPHLQESNDSSFKPWQKKSQLYFIDSNQELLTLEPESGMNDALEVFSIKQNVPMTAFSHFVAAKTVFNKEENASQVQESLNILRKTRTEEFFSAPAHTLPPMKMLCAAFIMALLANPLSRNQAQSDSIARNEHVENGETTDDEDEKDKKDTTKSSKRELSPIPASSDTEEQYVQLTRHNWDFLSSILPDSEGIEQS